MGQMLDNGRQFVSLFDSTDKLIRFHSVCVYVCEFVCELQSMGAMENTSPLSPYYIYVCCIKMRVCVSSCVYVCAMLLKRVWCAAPY